MPDLLSQVSPIIKAVIDLLVGSELLQVNMVYRRHTGESFNTTTGLGEANYEETSFKAATATHTTRSASVFGGGVEVGSRFFIIRQANIPSGASMKDQIQVESQNFRITDIHWLLSMGAIFTVSGGD